MISTVDGINSQGQSRIVGEKKNYQNAGEQLQRMKNLTNDFQSPTWFHHHPGKIFIGDTERNTNQLERGNANEHQHRVGGRADLETKILRALDIRQCKNKYRRRPCNVRCTASRSGSRCTSWSWWSTGWTDPSRSLSPETGNQNAIEWVYSTKKFKLSACDNSHVTSCTDATLGDYTDQRILIACVIYLTISRIFAGL